LDSDLRCWLLGFSFFLRGEIVELGADDCNSFDRLVPRVCRRIICLDVNRAEEIVAEKVDKNRIRFSIFRRFMRVVMWL
jgi:hypothetical protein